MTTTTRIRKSENELVQESIEKGYKYSQSEFVRAGGSFGDYYYNCYSRAYNKVIRAKEAAAKAEFAAGNASLLETLFAQTEMLKVEYLEKTAIWAEGEFARNEKVAAAGYPSRKEIFASYEGSEKPYSYAWNAAHKSYKYAINQCEYSPA